jgi:hypothetical protein
MWLMSNPLIWLERSRLRKKLLELAPRTLADIGISPNCSPTACAPGPGWPRPKVSRP